MNYTFLEQFILLDALSSPFQGMGRGHIASHFKIIEGFTDTKEALKDHPEKWRKSGLYTAYSQILFLLACCARKSGLSISDLHDIFEQGSLSPEEWKGIFRYPDRITAAFVERIIRPELPSEGVGGTAAVIYSVLLSLLASKKESSSVEMARRVLLFTTDPCSIVGSIIFEKLVRMSLNRVPNRFASEFTAVCQRCESAFDELLPWVFENGIDPLLVEKSLSYYKKMALILESGEASESSIVSLAGSVTKNSITRATVDMPLAMISFSIYCVDKDRLNGSFFESMLRYGGNVQQLILLTGMLIADTTILKEEFGNLTDDLVNKTKITAGIKEVASGRFTDKQFWEFFASERKLSQKCVEELKSICKHGKKSKKPTKPKKTQRMSIEEKLSQHVVSSWTKMDKARYKKEKRHVSVEED